MLQFHELLECRLSWIADNQKKEQVYRPWSMT
jgi:hypothetical protein